jgi:hypothetical protein
MSKNFFLQLRNGLMAHLLNEKIVMYMELNHIYRLYGNILNHYSLTCS